MSIGVQCERCAVCPNCSDTTLGDTPAASANYQRCPEDSETEREMVLLGYQKGSKVRFVGLFDRLIKENHVENEKGSGTVDDSK
jgi:hypothetical protein